MMEKLDLLRKEIDQIDQSLLKLLSRRLSLVSKVGEIKNRLGLLIYAPEREDVVISRRRQDAMTMGISPDLAEDVLRRIMRESHYIEHDKGFKKLYSGFRPVVIIGGRGQMGQFFFRMLTLSGYQVKLLDKDDWEQSESILTDVSVLFISVPINVVVQVINKLSDLPSDCIVVDLSSIKQHSLKAILNMHSGPVLGLHPMFSPDAKNMIKQVIICCEGRYPEAYRWLLEQLRLWGARLYFCDFIEHDKYMSFIQGLCHFVTFMIGYDLYKENINLEKILSFASPTFQLKLISVGRLFNQNPQLYADIIMESEDSIMLIKRYYARLGRMLVWLEKKDKQKFINKFHKVRCWLESCSNNFFMNGCKLLKQINDFKK